MAESTQRARWNRRHAERCDAEPTVCESLIEFERYLPRHGFALDLACGAGGNAIWLAERGLDVLAIDVSDVALAQIRKVRERLRIETQVADLATYPFDCEAADLIVVSRFLERGLCARIAAALAPGGLLLYQTFVGAYQGHGPRRADYRLASGELPALFAELDVVEYMEDPEAGPLSGYATLLARARSDD